MFPEDRRWAPRAVLGLYALSGLITVWWLARERTDRALSSYLVYDAAASAALAGEDFYAVAPEAFPTNYFLYPPVTVLAWLPSTLVEPLVGYAVLTAVSIAFGLAIAVVASRLVTAAGVELGRIDRVLLAVAAVGSAPALPTYLFGNVNVILAGLFALGLWYHHDDRPVAAGLAFGVAGLVKAFPALFGLWLVRLRSVRGTLAWMATGAVGLLAGVVIFGWAMTQTYVDEALLPRTEPDLFVGGLHDVVARVSLQQPLGLAVDVGGRWLAIIAAVVVLPVVLVLVADVGDIEGRLLAMLGITAGTLVVLPTYYVYLVFLLPAMLPLAYLLEGPIVRTLFFAGMVLIPVTMTPARLEVLEPHAPASLLGLVESGMVVARPPLVGVGLLLTAGVMAVTRRHGGVGGVVTSLVERG